MGTCRRRTEPLLISLSATCDLEWYRTTKPEHPRLDIRALLYRIINGLEHLGTL